MLRRIETSLTKEDLHKPAINVNDAVSTPASVALQAAASPAVDTNRPAADTHFPWVANAAAPNPAQPAAQDELSEFAEDMGMPSVAPMATEVVPRPASSPVELHNPIPATVTYTHRPAPVPPPVVVSGETEIRIPHDPSDVSKIILSMQQAAPQPKPVDGVPIAPNAGNQQ